MRSATDRRQPQKSDLRRSAILESLDHHLRESGFDGLNIADVAKRAGVTRSAFYFYFENKGAAVAALMERMVDETLAVTETFTSAADSPRRRIYAMLDGLFAMRDRHRHLFKAMLEVRGSSASVRDIWDGVIGDLRFRRNSARCSSMASVGENRKLARSDRSQGRRISWAFGPRKTLRCLSWCSVLCSEGL